MMKLMYFMDSIYVEKPFKCSAAGVRDIIQLLKWVINGIFVVAGVILIVLIVLDLFKLVTSNSADDKAKKEATGKIITRIVYAIVMFLVPSLLTTLFSIIPINVGGVNISNCWELND